MKYRKIPEEVQAIQFKIIKEIELKYGIHKEYNLDEISNFLNKQKIIRVKTVPSENPEGRTYLEFDTIEGTKEVNVNDYIVQNKLGQFSIYNPIKFELEYKPITD